VRIQRRKEEEREEGKREETTKNGCHFDWPFFRPFCHDFRRPKSRDAERLTPFAYIELASELTLVKCFRRTRLGSTPYQET
jgi:hypothetical protein